MGHTMKRTDETVYLQELVQDSYKQAETVRERVEIQKKRKIIPPHDFKFVLPIGILVAVGVFNRPTFVFFAFVPLFFWFQRGVSNKSMFTPGTPIYWSTCQCCWVHLHQSSWSPLPPG